VKDAALFYELADRLDRIEHQLAQLNGPIQLWIPKKKLAEHLGVSVRWIDYRVAEGLPHREIAGKVVFHVLTVEAWLKTRGLMKEIT
jgi:hypothetical protein